MESNSTDIEGRSSAHCSASSDLPLQPWQKAVLDAPKYSAVAGARKLNNPEWPWRPIGELGEIAYMEDGSYRWKVWAGYEDMRLFLVYLACGDIETHFAYIDEGGALCNEHGDDVGWMWFDAEYFMDIPARPSLPNASGDARRPDAPLA